MWGRVHEKEYIMTLFNERDINRSQRWLSRKCEKFWLGRFLFKVIYDILPRLLPEDKPGLLFLFVGRVGHSPCNGGWFGVCGG